jgi:hypothetical protein
MISSVESTHERIIGKISAGKSSLVVLRTISTAYRAIIIQLVGKKYKDCISILDSLQINLLLDSLETLENNYSLAVVPILAEYYANVKNEDTSTKSYYQTISSENFCGGIDDIINRTMNIVDSIHRILQKNVVSRTAARETENNLYDVTESLTRAKAIEIVIATEKRNYEICSCGTQMTVVPELSELQCEVCLQSRTIIGTVFRDDQFYPQEGQKTKHGGYDTDRHYRFWMERLLARETKAFSDTVLENIAYVIKRDQYIRKMLNCEQMREILKDPMVNATTLNDHAPLLVKTFGGKAPPQIDFKDWRLAATRFSKAMKYYDIVNPVSGNKPYYPYFIYKNVEEQFDDNSEKLRLLDYIHLQSRETVVKNDKFYEQMCALDGAKEAGLIYRPTDPAGRL